MRISDWSSYVCSSDLMSFVLRPPILQRYEEAVIFLEWLSQQYSSQMDSLRHELAMKASTSDRPRRERCYVETAGISGYPTFRIAILALHPSFQNSKERRVGNERVSTGRTRCAP